MRTIHTKAALTDEEADKLGGTFLDESHFDVLVTSERPKYPPAGKEVLVGDTKVLKPDGSVLLIFRAKVLPEQDCNVAQAALRDAASVSFNRGYAAGEIEDQQDVRDSSGFERSIVNGSRFMPIKKDGTKSKTAYAKAVLSGIIGYYGRYPRNPYCRLTSFNLDHPEKFKAALPFIQGIDTVFKKEMPDRYKAQMKVVRKTSQDFVINKTAFTTITVNRNFRTAVHQDAGDLKEGFGVMSALRSGIFRGCYLCFPKYRVAADMRTGDVLLADVHEWHGNTPVITWTKEGGYERISCVFYYREDVKECGTHEEEQAIAEKWSTGHNDLGDEDPAPADATNA